MFKGFSNRQGFHGFPRTIAGGNTNVVYGVNNCIFWLDAQSLISLNNLDSVSSWRDKIRNISYENSVLASQPRFIASNPNYNNNPTVESIAAARRLVAVNGLLLTGNYTLVLICNYNSITAINAAIGNSVNDFGFGPGGTSAGINGFFCRNNQTPQIISGTSESVTPKIAVFTSENGIFVNGVVENGSLLNPFNLVLNVLFSGTGANNVSLFGHIAEILAFGYSLNSSEAINLSNQLNAKYAIY